MSKFIVINKIILVENVYCVFRNYTDLKPKVKTFVKLFIIVVTSFHLWGSLTFCQNTLKVLKKSSSTDMVHFSVIMYISLATIITLGFIVLSILYSNSFKIYTECINGIYEICKGDIVFMKSIDNLNRRVLRGSLMISTVVFGTIVTIVVEYLRFYYQHDVFAYFVSKISDCIVQSRYYVEILAYYILTEVIVACLQYLNSSILVYAGQLQNKDQSDEDFSILEANITEWWMLSKHVSVCSEKLSSCFDLEIAIMLFSSTLYYILLLYRSVCVLMQPEQTMTAGVHVLIILMLNYTMVTLMIVRSGQRVRDEARKLDTSLALFYSLLKSFSGHEAAERARATLALSRRLRAAPLRVRLLAWPVQMSLLTAVLAITADYTIILLQFNRVV